jgi:HEAT repeat protein
LFPAFLHEAQDPGNWALRNNAVIALGCYPEQRAVVAPVLLEAAGDRPLQVVLVAVKSLNAVAPDLATNAAVVVAVIDILKNPDDQIAYRAAELLGELKAEPALAVPALVSALASPSRIVRVDSASALLQFNQPADLLLPALRAIAEHEDFPDSLRRRAQDKISQMK